MEIIFFNGKNVDFYSVHVVEIEPMVVWMEICYLQWSLINFIVHPKYLSGSDSLC